MKFNRLIPSSMLLVLVLVLLPGHASAANLGYTYHSSVSGIPAQPGPFGIAFDSDNLCLYVADSSGYVSVIGGSSTNICGPHYQKITDIPLLGCQSGSYTPSAIAYDSHNHELYVGCYNFNANPSSLVEVLCGSPNPTICGPMNGVICSGIPLPSTDIVSAIAFDPNTNNLYIATNSATVDVLSDTGCGPVLSTTCTGLYSTNCVISLASTCCGGQTLGAAYDQHNHLLYVATCCSTSGSRAYGISEVTNTVVSTICLRGPGCALLGSSYPAAVAIDTDAHEVFITDENANTVYYFPDNFPNNANTLVVNDPPIQIHGPIGATYDSANHRVYVTNFNPTPYTVSVIFNHQVVDTVYGNGPPVKCGAIPVGPSPYYLAFDPDDHSIYVANHGGTGTVTIFEPINPTYPHLTCTF